MSVDSSLVAMLDIVSEFAKEDGRYQTRVDGLVINRQSAPVQSFNASQRPCFALVLQGAKTLQVGSDFYHYGVGDCLVAAVSLPCTSSVIRASIKAPHFGLALAFDPDRLRCMIGRVGKPPLNSTNVRRAVDVSTASSALLEATLRLLSLLKHEEDIPVMAPLIQDEILYRLATGPFGPRLLQIAIAETPSNRVARAIAWLRRNYDQPLRIDELAKRVGMSESSLYHHFRAVTALTPMQYQKQLRLYEARKIMLSDQLDVGDASFRVGYRSVAQFTREYSRFYGHPPGRDTATTRRAMLSGSG